MFRQGLIKKYIDNGFEKNEAVAELDLIYEFVANFTVKDILMGKELKKQQISEITDIVQVRLSQRKPIQQILGRSYFMGDVFFVNKHTLIPRPETELLVLEVLKNIKSDKQYKILDIGSGSGCIAIEIAKHAINSVVTSVDVSFDALKIAKQNSKNLGVSERVEFIESDLFSNVSGIFDIIVSNPPYIPVKEKETLQQEVRDFEPHGALFAYDETGVEFYKNIIQHSKKYLKKGGFLLFELGINQAEEVNILMEKNGFCNVILTKDFSGIDRVISGCFI